MRNLLTLLCLFSLIIMFNGCNKNKQENKTATTASFSETTNFTTQTQLHAVLGNPNEIQTSTISSGSTIEKYGTTSYQISPEGKIEATMSDPNGDQNKLQYWFHYWGNQNIQSIVNKDNTITYKTKVSKQAVVFDRSTNKIIRIIKL